MKSQIIRKITAALLTVIFIAAFAAPAYADELLEGAPGAEDVGMLPQEMMEPKDEGECGDNIRYSFNNSTGVVTLTGTGETYNYSSMYGPNVNSRIFRVNGDVYTLNIGNGITVLKERFIPESDTLVNIVIPKSVKKIEDYNFHSLYNRDEIVIFYDGTYEDWQKIDIGTGNNLSGYFVLFKDEWFKDVIEAKKYYFYPVYWANAWEVTSGYGNGLFQPNAVCTRAMIVTFLYNLAGKPEVNGTTAFSDVKSGDWYYNAVSWAVKNGITSGYGTGTFAPNAKCTRAMMVTFLKNFAAPDVAVEYKDVFPDVGKNDWFAEAVVWAKENGIATGIGGYFKPNKYCTRAEAVTFLYKYFLETVTIS